MHAPEARARSRFAMLMRRCGRALLDAAYPRACRACDRPLPAGEDEPPGLEAWLCPLCDDGLTRVAPPFCSVCGEPFDGAMTAPFRCMNCADRKLAFEFAVAGYRTEGAAREMIHRFKYGRDQSLRAVLAAMLERALEDPRLAGDAAAGWLLVPVPLFHAKESERGFNQSRELCRVLSRRTGMPVADCLLRVRDTGSQASLHRNERLENLRRAFAMRRTRFLPPPDVRGARILLVDDVLTTGATTHECARVLRRDGGAEKVVVITVARG